MATDTELFINKNKGVRMKRETTPGTFVSMDDTNNIPVVDLDWKWNPDTKEQVESNFSIDEGEVAVYGVRPNITGSVLLRGGGAAATPPIYGPILDACGWDDQTATRLPAASTTTCAGGSTSTATVDTGTAVGWPTTAGGVADLVGRVATLTSPNATAVIIGASIASGIITLKLHKTLGAAVTSSSTIVLIAGMRYEQLNDPQDMQAVSIECFRAGKKYQFNGGRGSCSIKLEGNGQGTLAFDIKAAREGSADATLPDIASTFATLPAAPRWNDGVAYVDSVPVAMTSLEYNQQGESAQHPDPNIQGGLLPALVTSRKPRGTMQFNSMKEATHDFYDNFDAEKLQPVVCLLNQNGAVGTRVVLVMTSVKFLDVTNADYQGLADDAYPYQAIFGGILFFY